MIAWIVMRAVPWARANPKLVLYIVGSLAISLFVGYKVYAYGTRMIEKGRQEEFKRGLKEATDLHLKKEAVLLSELAGEKQKNAEGVAKNEADRKLLAAREEELLRARHALEFEKARTAATAEASIAAGHAAAAALTDRDAADKITAFAKRLAADKDWRKRIPAASNPVP